MFAKPNVHTDIVLALADLPQPLDLTDAETAYVVWGTIRRALGDEPVFGGEPVSIIAPNS